LCVKLVITKFIRSADGHLQRVTIPDDVLIQFDLMMMMNTTLLETCKRL